MKEKDEKNVEHSNKVQDMSEPLLVLALVEVAATMAAGRGLAPARAATKAEDREAEWEEEDADGDDVESGTTAATADEIEELVPFTAAEADEAAAAAAASKRLIPLSMEPSPSSQSALREVAAEEPAARFLISGVSPMFWIFNLLSSSVLK